MPPSVWRMSSSSSLGIIYVRALRARPGRFCPLSPAPQAATLAADINFGPLGVDALPKSRGLETHFIHGLLADGGSEATGAGRRCKCLGRFV